ncbi:hypothetical protein [Bacillus sp. 165]|uniref:hypothetical protein n=1 Tax=Bacillus sp. 165 TaxID=1529117 RepID=UPI001ADAF393|nr:hypothetical protein [Bacillus sp. 165]MBO9130872.1 hypothetical protein [Bacillus sp. 165]
MYVMLYNYKKINLLITLQINWLSQEMKCTKRKIEVAFIVVGILFLVNAIFCCYIVLPGFMESLENGASSAGSIPEPVEVWKIVRYLVWAYSFKLGVYFIILGALMKTNIRKWTLTLYSVIGFLYIRIAYMPFSFPSWLFGAFGGIMIILILLIIFITSKERMESPHHTTKSVDLKLISYFFFAVATHNLCAL